MAEHEFGIMQKTPENDERYDAFEPEKYGCISVCDDYIEPLLDKLSRIECYWHTLARQEKGLAYYGITLIPPRALDEFISCIDGTPNLGELENLLKVANEEDKFIIHFGI